VSERSEITLILLNEALDRIVSGAPEVVKPKKSISVSMVEREAGFGVGTAYYYPDLIQRIKQSKEKTDKPKISSKPRAERKSAFEELSQKSEEITELQQKVEQGVQREANLVYHLWRAQEKMREMENKLAHNNVVPFPQN
jgi:DNA repair exonuclease SbcCD ATPase subunit